MADSDLIKWAVQIGGPMAALLVVCGYFYRKDMKYYADQYRADMKFYTDQMRAVTQELLTVVKDNTQAFTGCMTVVQSLHRHMTDQQQRQDSKDREGK